MGKQHRVSFNKHAQKKSKIPELVYSDVCGPMSPRTLGGSSYFVTFIDDHSRKLWAYPLKSKDQVFDVAFVHVPKDERTKLDNKSKQCVFLSYGDDKFGYKLYDPVARKIVRIRDVVFFEDQTINEFNKEVQIESGDRGLVEDESDEELEIKYPTIAQENSRTNDTMNANGNDVISNNNMEEVSHNSELNDSQLSEPGEIDNQGTPQSSSVVRTSIRDQIPSTKYPPHEVCDQGKEHIVCKLEKSLYVLKQAPRQWYKKFDSFMGEYGFTRTLTDHCVFIKRFSNDDFIVLLLYVDDMLIVGKDINKINELNGQLSNVFEMKDLGNARYILGMDIERDPVRRSLWLSQERYILKVLARFNMETSKPVNCPLSAHFKLSSKTCPQRKIDIEDMQHVPYASAVGSLMYAMLCKDYWEALKWILRYLKGHQIGASSMREKVLHWRVGDLDSKKSTSGYLFIFAGGEIYWQSRLQRCISLSTTEAEYIAITECCKELLWLKRFFKEVGIKQENFTILCDSQTKFQLLNLPEWWMMILLFVSRKGENCWVVPRVHGMHAWRIMRNRILDFEDSYACMENHEESVVEFGKESDFEDSYARLLIVD
ncbi:transmembrane signal receptor [Lithospermum erythrorhizon]|uniref:Transmembrane signal receptor n=1 Tax=Lithospermum erythrorhizon TaxID=34254 RepID=A0AAV3NRN8_LITER